MKNLFPEQNIPSEMNKAETVSACPSLTLSVEQMAAVLNISRNTAYELVKHPGFPCFHVGKRILVNRDMLQVWLNNQCRRTA